MVRTKIAIALAGSFGLVTLALVACGSGDFDPSTEGRGSSGTSGGTSGGGTSGGTSGGGPDFGPAKAGDVGSPAATGVVLVHSASFPSFRLCFERYPDLLPQPDKNVMPAANVVGVEIGGAVRIDTLREAPGQVYVIDETQIREQSGSTNPPNCGELIGTTRKTERTLQELNEYHLADKIEQPLGVGKVDVLAITGCGDLGTLKALDGREPDPKSCGTWDGARGNLVAKVATLTPSPNGPSDSEIPVQLFPLAPAAENLKSEVTVRFGLQGDAGVPLTPNTPTTLKVDQTKEQSYGELAFEVTAKLNGAEITTRQTLAEVQQLSAPGDLPTTYYRTASNYALLMVGDPSHGPKQGDGGTNPTYNPRRALHIIAVPVLDPAKLPDGGTDAAVDAGPPAISP